MEKDQEIISAELEMESVPMPTLDASSETILSDNPGAPNIIHILPITRRPFFPGMAAPIFIEPGPFFDLLKLISKSNDKTFGLVLTKSEQLDVYKANISDLYPMGVLGRILRIIPAEQGGAQVILNMEKRFTLLDQEGTGHPMRAHVVYHQDSIAQETPELKAYSSCIIATIKDLLKLNPLFKEELQVFLGHSDFTDPGRLADFAVTLTTASREELQDVLSTQDVSERIDKALLLLKKEMDISTLQNTISKRTEAAISKNQKEYYLREQMKSIRKELGLDKEDKVLEREKFEARIKERKIPEDVQKVIQNEMDKLSILEPHGAEYGVTRNYLDWLTNIPWGVYDVENHDLKAASAILDEDHHGLKDIKERILEFMAVGKLSGNVKGSILCLVGPPGVGKTSVGKSIARALNRKFYRFSVGGMRDEAEIKGHRRTYIGAMPGKLIQALKVCQTMNPVIMLDEIDKIGGSYHGDPAASLLEVLDPEQNSSFLDHYLDVRCNLSDILFIVTANQLDTIPEALRDRMEVLRLSGYILEEKLEIAKKHLIPRHNKEMGFQKEEIEFSKEAIKTMITSYAREAGVRTLESQIKKVLRKVATEIVRTEQTSKKGKAKSTPVREKIVIKPDNVEKYLGKPFFSSELLYEQTPVGVATGLAWTSLGGSPIYIEAVKVPGDKNQMKLTGQPGSVMKESSEIAWTYLESAVHRYIPSKSFFEKAQVHLHIPEGATPKDGPSAGITMVTAMLSLLSGKKVKPRLGMTGELSLTGQVLPVGGIKEKFVAARRAKLNRLILPKKNLRDYEELDENIKNGIHVDFVEHYDEVFSIAFSKSKPTAAK